MEQTGEYRIAASRELVWAALNDPVVLARCIDGCQSMQRIGDDRFKATVKAKIGPVSALFTADLKLEDVQPPSAYTLNAEVKGGAAGFARGSARVELEEAEDATILRYRVNANVGGKLAQVGSRLIDAAARKMAGDFFGAFCAELGVVEPGSAELSSTPSSVSSTSRYEPSGQWKIWFAVFLVLVIALVLAF